jgi:hypothetical protein
MKYEIGVCLFVWEQAKKLREDRIEREAERLEKGSSTTGKGKLSNWETSRKIKTALKIFTLF